MHSVRASGSPILSAKCEKSAAIARVAEVKIHAQGRDSTYSRKRSAISKGVNCSVEPIGASLHPAQARLFRELAQAGQRIGQMRRAARAVGGARAAAQALELRRLTRIKVVSISGSASKNVSGRSAHS